MSGKIIAICLSPTKGTPKKPVDQGCLKKDFGLENDAHAGNWHRQVSLLDYSKIQEFNLQGAQVQSGDFGENIIIDGLKLSQLKVGDRLRLGGEALLEITQRGKECHNNHCAIHDRVGDCIMPREGLFAKVITGGQVKIDDPVIFEPAIGSS